MRNWLIRKLGGYPPPEEGISLLVYADMDDPKFPKFHNEVHIEDGKKEVVYYCGGFPFPKSGEGQIVVGPVVRKLPVRKKPLTPGDISNSIEGLQSPVTTSDCPIAKSCTIVPCPGVSKCFITHSGSLAGAVVAAGGEVHVTEMKMTMLNLCDTCQASAQDCRKAIKEVDQSNNTTGCDQHK